MLAEATAKTESQCGKTVQKPYVKTGENAEVPVLKNRTTAAVEKTVTPSTSRSGDLSYLSLSDAGASNFDFEIPDFLRR
jgi:hypothetical protein